MPASLPSRAASRRPSFLLCWGLLLPAGLACTATLLRDSGLDDALTRLCFDAGTGAFLLPASGAAEWLLHRVGRSLLVGLWLLLLAAALAASRVPALRPHRTVLWATVAGMALGPVLVTLLKDINSRACPWNLKAYGGTADASSLWFVPRALAGRCFPGGHAAGGFSLFALAFAGEALGHRGLRRAGLVLALAVGTAFSLLRVAQGAHFLSHNLWSAAIDLALAGLVFAPLLGARRPRAGGRLAIGGRP
jgi:membrane-associated PAP2 superfamily phosphatase